MAIEMFFSVAFMFCLLPSSALSCPSFTSSLEEGKAVCPGEELNYTCTIFDGISTAPTAVWSGFCADGSVITIIHGTSQESGMSGNFSVQATGSDGGCYNSTLSVTAAPELNGTVIQCSYDAFPGVPSIPVELVGETMLLLYNDCTASATLIAAANLFGVVSVVCIGILCHAGTLF